MSYDVASNSNICEALPDGPPRLAQCRDTLPCGLELPYRRELVGAPREQMVRLAGLLPVPLLPVGASASAPAAAAAMVLQSFPFQLNVFVGTFETSCQVSCRGRNGSS